METLSELPGAVEPTALVESVPLNRISVPFLQIQERKWLLATLDAGIAAAVMVLGYRLWRIVFHPLPREMPVVPWEWVFGAAAAWLLFSWLAGAYELDTADRFPRAARSVFTVTVLTFVTAILAYYLFLKTYPRPALLFDSIALPVAVLGWRGLYAAALGRPAGATRLLVVGPHSFYTALAEEAAQKSAYYRVVGFVGQETDPHPGCRGDLASLDAIIESHQIHGLVVAPRQELSDRLVAALCACVERGVQVLDFNAAYEEIAEKLAVEHADRHWLAALPTRPGTSPLEEAAIRALDLIGAVLGLALTVIATPVIAAAILIESGRPVFYGQVRLGQAGRPFTMHKFRSMRPDSEPGGEQWAVSGDGRITAVGRFLRRTHLDELPQFWNVLRGEMSLVGPRPERPAFTDELSRSIPFYRLRLAVRPGLTGLKQLRVGYASTIEEHLEVLRHDLYYIKHRSMALNVLIIARTLGAVLGMDGR